jgi:hypothetical protein
VRRGDFPSLSLYKRKNMVDINKIWKTIMLGGGE